MAKPSASPARNLTPQVPGANPIAAPTAAAPQPLVDASAAVVAPMIPEGLAEELATKTNEELIALDAAERDGDNRPGYLVAIEAALQQRLAAIKNDPAPPAPTLDVELPKVEPAPVAPERPAQSRPHSSEIDASKITQPVLCEEGWVVPSTATPPPIR